jgi:hypothetical protein
MTLVLIALAALLIGILLLRRASNAVSNSACPMGMSSIRTIVDNRCWR